MILLQKYKKKISQPFAAKQVNHNWCFLRSPKFKVTSFRDFAIKDKIFKQWKAVLHNSHSEDKTVLTSFRRAVTCTSALVCFLSSYAYTKRGSASPHIGTALKPGPQWAEALRSHAYWWERGLQESHFLFTDNRMVPINQNMLCLYILVAVDCR